MNILLVAIGGFIGAICRFLVSIYFKRVYSSPFPLGTLLINLTGSFFLGMLVGLNIHGYAYSFIGIGFMGAFTTFSTFMLEAFQLKHREKQGIYYTYIILSCFGGIGLALLGISLTK
jgi:fluoride exporter